MSAAIKERGILFKSPMVRAILEGRKTQTRRIMKPQYDGDALCSPKWFHTTKEDTHGQLTDGDLIFGTFDDNGEFGARFPYGAIGDRLWVRETWCRSRNNTFYRADHGDGQFKPNELSDVWDWDRGDGEKWRPSIFMPRSLSRITLEIIGVRVERLQDISEYDARTEGVAKMKRDPASSHQWLFEPVFGCDHPSGTLGNARACFELGWKKINGKDSWSANPWLWVIEFQRVQSCKAKS